jgi:hypothetical protein
VDDRTHGQPRTSADASSLENDHAGGDVAALLELDPASATCGATMLSAPIRTGKAGLPWPPTERITALARTLTPPSSSTGGPLLAITTP